MKTIILVLLMACGVGFGADFTLKPGAVTLTVFSGSQHLQDTTTDGEFIWWCFTGDLVKSQFDGTYISEVSLGADHFGGLCHRDGFIYIAWTDTGNNWDSTSINKIKVYNGDDLSFVEEHVLSGFQGGIGCIAYRNGVFVVGETLHTATHPLRLLEFNEDFTFLEAHTIVQDFTLKGTEAIDWINDRWLLSTAIEGFKMITVDVDFNVTDLPDFALGLEGLAHSKNNLFIISSSTGAGPFGGQYFEAIEGLPLNQSVIAKWGLNDDAESFLVEESSQNSNHGISQRLTNLYSTDAGKIGKALDFDEFTPDYFTAQPINLGDDDFSFAVWIKLTDTGSQMINIEGVDPRVYFRVSSGGILQFTMDDGVTLLTEGSAATVTDGQWHLVLAICDRQNDLASVYIDNVIGSTPLDISSLGTLQNNNDILVGIRNTLDETFDGIMDEVIIFDKALTSDDRDELWNGGDGINLVPLESPVKQAGTTTGGLRSRYGGGGGR